LKSGHELLSLERQTVLYLVPRFEEAALAEIPFRGIPWRRADLLHLRKRSESSLEIKTPLERQSVSVFSRSQREFRVFIGPGQTASSEVMLEPLEAYSHNISTRAHSGESPDVWTTEKTGARIGKREMVQEALRVWSDSEVRTKARAVDRLNVKYPGQGQTIVNEMDRVFGLWSQFATQPALRTDDEVEEKKRSSLTDWANAVSQREHAHDGDKFRGHYQRDRDRILWAASFRKLGHKTQLFPSDQDDHTRQRLTHSIEVMQLASTIGASFGLDRELIEAGALAHDIGHTPFGHAGEHALNMLFNTIHPKLGGFNHYEHGVDVVRWLEGPYFTSSATSFHGLNLTSAVAECILKHTYCHGGDGISSEILLRSGKYDGYIPDGYCHLEGQAVRIADKISYFVSDLEDGLRLGAISIGDLLACHFFHRPPLNFQLSGHVSPYQSFLAQRRGILKILMEDVLVATSKRLARTTPEGVRKATEYMVNHSEAVNHDVKEVWERLQVARLHEDRRVKLANLKATRIVSDLTLLFAASPGFVDADFSSEYARLKSSKYMNYYRGGAGKTVLVQPELLAFVPLERLIGSKHSTKKSLEIPVEDVVMAKDFVAGLTDSRARRLHLELLGG
jgi:dGTPase